MTTLRRHWPLVAAARVLILAFVVLVMAFASAAGDVRSPLFLKMLELFAVASVMVVIYRLLEWQRVGISWRALYLAVASAVGSYILWFA